MHNELKDFAENIVDEISCPLLMQPPLITELASVVNGVISDLKAYKAGIKRGYIIKKVNGLVPIFRVEAWNSAINKVFII